MKRGIHPIVGKYVDIVGDLLYVLKVSKRKDEYYVTYYWTDKYDKLLTGFDRDGQTVRWWWPEEYKYKRIDFNAYLEKL